MEELLWIESVDGTFEQLCILHFTKRPLICSQNKQLIAFRVEYNDLDNKETNMIHVLIIWYQTHMFLAGNHKLI